MKTALLSPALKLLASLPDPPPNVDQAQYAAVLTAAVMTQVALVGAVQAIRAKKGGHPTKGKTKKNPKMARRLVLNFGKSRGRAVITFDDSGDGGDEGGSDAGTTQDPGNEPTDGGESTAGTVVDVDPPTDSPDPGSMGDTISAAADALGQVINEIDVGEAVDEIFNTLMNEP